MKKRTAKDFSRKQIYEIAKAYATGKYTHYDFTIEYNCNQQTFYTLLNWAVVKCIVPDDIVEAIEIVAISNSSNMARVCFSDEQFIKAVTRRGRECNKLRLFKRNHYIFPKHEAISLINQYIDDISIVILFYLKNKKSIPAKSIDFPYLSVFILFYSFLS